MGGSQSKFKPEPNDVWYKVKVTGSQPVFLQSVLQAIVDLKEAEGSSQGRIIDYIQSIINSKQIRPRPRNVAMQVKKALIYAVSNGLVKQHSGKFIMALTEKEFAIFKGFRPVDPIKETVRAKKRKRKSKGRVRRVPKRKQTNKRLRSVCLDDIEDFELPRKRQKRKKLLDLDSDINSEYESDVSSNSDNIESKSASSTNDLDDDEPLPKKRRKTVTSDFDNEPSSSNNCSSNTDTEKENENKKKLDGPVNETN